MDLDVIRRRLDEEREELQQMMQGGQERLDAEGEGNAGELSSVDQHPADVGTETFEREKEQSLAQGAEERLRDVEGAFRKLDEGTYGTCEICDRPIGEDRLEARPAARFCIEHQKDAERENGSSGGSAEMAPPP